MWKKLMQIADIGDPTSFLDLAYLEYSQLEFKLNIRFFDLNTEMFELRISTGVTEKLPDRQKSDAKTLTCGPTTWRDILKNVLSDNMKWQIRKWSIFTNFQVLAWMTIYSSRRNSNQLENGQKICSEIVLKCLHLTRTGRSHILWSNSKFARSVLKWNQTCDRRIVRLFSYIHHTNDFWLYYHVGNTI